MRRNMVGGVCASRVGPMACRRLSEVIAEHAGTIRVLHTLRNDGRQRSASHVVEIAFTVPPDFPHGGISNIPGILMNYGGTTPGMPLGAGVPFEPGRMRS